MLSVVAQVKAQARLANAELIFYFLKTPNTLHTKQNEKILTRSNADKELSGLGFLRHLIQKEDSLSLIDLLSAMNCRDSLEETTK